LQSQQFHDIITTYIVQKKYSYCKYQTIQNKHRIVDNRVYMFLVYRRWLPRCRAMCRPIN